MKDEKQIIELEYRFLIPASSLELIPPKEISGFNFVEVKEKILDDTLFEREGTTLKSENVGFRIRKTSKGIEFTYKKFLGRENGVVSYDETTKQINEETLEKFKQGDFEDPELPILIELEKSGKLYFLLNIHNKRKIYLYKCGSSEVELTIEELIYQVEGNEASDSMLEIEFRASEEDRQIVEKFAEEIKKLFKCEVLNEGKNARAERLLGITLK